MSRITAEHLTRAAYVYIRQSTADQLAHNHIRDATVPLAKLRTRRDELQSTLHKVYKSAPRTDDEAYSKAQTALKDNEELTFSDTEIDALLPAPLRRA